MTDSKQTTQLKHRRSTVFIDELVDRFTAMSISWNGHERIHITFGRDSLEVKDELIVEDPDTPGKAKLEVRGVEPYRNDVAAIAMPIDVAEHLAATILKMVTNAKEREKQERKDEGVNV